MSEREFFDGFLDTVTPEERAPFGANWCGPAALKHNKPTLVASYAGDLDRRDVEVYCTSLPACFYTVVVMKRMPFSILSKVPAFKLGTGSGQGKLAADIALALSNGMLDME